MCSWAGGEERVDRNFKHHFLCLCSDDVAEQYTTLYSTMKEVYLKLLSLGLQALVYNGDTDMACNFLGNQWFVEDLGLKVGALILVTV